MLDSFAGQCRELQTSPDSSFVQTTVCERFVPDGLIMLRGAVLRHVTAQGVTTDVVPDAASYVSVLKTRFDLDLPEMADCWPRIWAAAPGVAGGGAQPRAESGLRLRSARSRRHLGQIARRRAALQSRQAELKLRPTPNRKPLGTRSVGARLDRRPRAIEDPRQRPQVAIEAAQIAVAQPGERRPRASACRAAAGPAGTRATKASSLQAPIGLLSASGVRFGET